MRSSNCFIRSDFWIKSTISRTSLSIYYYFLEKWLDKVQPAVQQPFSSLNQFVGARFLLPLQNNIFLSKSSSCNYTMQQQSYKAEGYVPVHVLFPVWKQFTKTLTSLTFEQI